MNPLYLFRERVEKSGVFRREQNISPKIWPKRPAQIVVWVEGEIRGGRTGARKRQAMQSGTHFAKTGGFRSHGTRLFHACWGAAPIPAEEKSGVAVGKGNFWRITACLYCDFPSEHWTRIRTNNVIERLNREIRRRTRVVGTFPDGNSALMLVCARLRHVAGTQWGNKKYMNMKHLEAALDNASIAG